MTRIEALRALYAAVKSETFPVDMMLGILAALIAHEAPDA
jgi:hypothetical protein